MPRTNVKEVQDWMGKEIHWELCKRLKFDHTTQLESFLENQTHKIPMDFEIQPIN